MTQGAAITSNTLTPVYTGNNIQLWINNIPISVVQHISIQRVVGRQPVHQVGTSAFADAPVTATMATITCTNAVTMPSSTVQRLYQAGILPAGTLVESINMQAYQMFLVDATGAHIGTILNAFFNGDSLDIAGNNPLSINFTLIAQDCYMTI